MESGFAPIRSAPPFAGVIAQAHLAEPFGLLMNLGKPPLEAVDRLLGPFAVDVLPDYR